MFALGVNCVKPSGPTLSSSYLSAPLVQPPSARSTKPSRSLSSPSWHCEVSGTIPGTLLGPPVPGVGVIVGVRLAVDVGVAVLVGVEVGVRVAVAVAVRVGVAVLLAVALGVAVLEAVGEGVAVLVRVAVAVAKGVLSRSATAPIPAGVEVAVAVGALVGVATGMAVGVGGLGPSQELHRASSSIW